MLPFSVCLYMLEASNSRRYRHDFFCIRQPRVSPRSCLIWLTSVNPFLSKFCPKVTPGWCGRRRHSTANCGWVVRDRRDGHHGEPKPPSLFRMVPSLTPTTSPSPKRGSHMHPPGTNSRRELPPDQYERRYRQEPSDVAFCQITLTVVNLFPSHIWGHVWSELWSVDSTPLDYHCA